MTTARRLRIPIAAFFKGWYGAGMREPKGPFAIAGIVLQDKKRLPGRFFARVSGALTALLG